MKVGKITLPDGREATLDWPGDLVWSSDDKPLETELNARFGHIPGFGPSDGCMGWYQLKQAADHYGATLDAQPAPFDPDVVY